MSEKITKFVVETEKTDGIVAVRLQQQENGDVNILVDGNLVAWFSAVGPARLVVHEQALNNLEIKARTIR